MLRARRVSAREPWDPTLTRHSPSIPTPSHPTGPQRSQVGVVDMLKGLEVDDANFSVSATGGDQRPRAVWCRCAATSTHTHVGPAPCEALACERNGASDATTRKTRFPCILFRSAHMSVFAQPCAGRVVNNTTGGGGASAAEDGTKRHSDHSDAPRSRCEHQREGDVT